MRATLAAITLIGACSSSNGDTGTSTAGTTLEQCSAEFAESKGYGHEDDLRVATSPAGDAAPPVLTPAVDEAVDECLVELGAMALGACDRASITTRDAAICVARAEGLAEGLEPWRAGIVFHRRERRIVWNVQNLLSSDPGGSQHGSSLRIDAITGAVLEQSEWNAIP